MILETLSTYRANPLLAASPLVGRALDWAARVDEHSELGRFPLEGDDFYASVQQRQPRPRAERAMPEAHRVYVDLQYCVAGGEIIDWYPLEGLVPTTDHDTEGDFRLFARPAHPPLPLLMCPGTFALLFPRDAHVPMIADGVHSSCRMIVFKIRCGLFEQQAAALAK